MNKLLLSLLFLLSFSAMAWDAPEVNEGACYKGCTPAIWKMYNNFLNTPTAPKFIPGMYSGDCHHVSDSLDANTTHYLGLLIDQDEKGITMSPVLQFFGDSNDMKDWSLETARKEMSGDWKVNEKVKMHPTSLTAHFEDDEGNPVLVYWARQNLKTKEIYFTGYLRGFSMAFCTVHPNVNGLPKSE
jgi:hypothetical protein